MGNASGREEAADGVDGGGQSRGRSDNGDGNLPSSLLPESSAGYMANSPPGGPSRSPSPQLFTPQFSQHLVASLPEADADSPMFNHMWRREPPTPAVDSPPQKGIPTLITWSHGGNNVAVEGSWDNWATRKAMQRVGKDHSLLLVLPFGIFHYRFVVDGETRCSPDLPFVSDEMGIVCHVLDVNDYVPESLDGVSQFQVPGSPESSYDQHFLEEDDFSRDPVMVPSQLHTTVIDAPKAEDSSLRPQHVVLNHLYMEQGWASESLVGLGLTHRFKSKYVIAVLYKPVKR